jgi:hypothetical protein
VQSAGLSEVGVESRDRGGGCSVAEEKTGPQAVRCSNCGYEFPHQPGAPANPELRGVPCPECGHTRKIYDQVLPITATGTAKVSKTVAKTLRITSKAKASLSWVHTGERVREYFEFWLKLQNSYDLSLIEWHGEKRISQVLLEAEVDRANQLPGDYELMAVRGEERSPVGGSARPGRDYLEFDFPDNVRLRIAEPPPATRPKVASYEFQPPS